MPTDPPPHRRDQNVRVHQAQSAAEGPAAAGREFQNRRESIAAYLSNTYGTPENTLIPSDPREHATWLEWCFYAATELDATSLYVMRRHGDLKHIYGEAPIALESAAEYFATQLRHAEQTLQDGRPFLIGTRLTTADMLLTTCLTWAVNYRVPVTAACLAYMEKITSRPVYHASVEANKPRTA
jgi:glutathione S-transferase